MSTRYPEPFWLRAIPFGRFWFRFWTGRPLDGIRRTDAVFRHPGRHSLDPSGHASKWSMLAGWQRLVIRLVVSYVLTWGALLGIAKVVRWTWDLFGAVAPGWAGTLTPGAVLAWHLVIGVLIGGPAVGVLAVRTFGLSVKVPAVHVGLSRTGSPVRVRLDGWVPWSIEGKRTWDRTYVRPLAAAADSVLGTYHRPGKSHTWVRVPRSFREVGGAPVSIALPHGFTGADKGVADRLTRTVAARLGLRDPEVTWELEGESPRVTFAAPPVPPTLVEFRDVRAEYEASEEFRPFLGQAARGRGLHGHMVSDSPHIAVSAGPGAGKSELIKGIAMQALRWGWGLVILDWKEVSHEWAVGLPGVTYVRDIADIHDMCVRLGEEVDIRKAAYRADSALPGRAKIMVICEEMNITADLLSAYWTDLRQTAEPEERRTMPLKSPAIRGLQATNFAGRQLSLFLVYVAQRFSSRVTNGNADLRESFQIRLMARYSAQTVKMLAPDVKPFPKVPTVLGQWIAVIAGEAIRYQAPLITDSEAREYAMGGKPNPPHPLTSAFYPDEIGTGDPASPSGPNMIATQGDVLGGDPTPPSPVITLEKSTKADAIEGEILAPIDARKLSDMVDALEPLGITIHILRSASKDPDSGFPPVYGGSPNRGYTYDFHAVSEWARRRHARYRAEKEAP